MQELQINCGTNTVGRIYTEIFENMLKDSETKEYIQKVIKML